MQDSLCRFALAPLLIRLTRKPFGWEGNCITVNLTTEQNRRYIQKELGKLLAQIWHIKALSEQEYSPKHPITKELGRMHADLQALLQEERRDEN